MYPNQLKPNEYNPFYVEKNMDQYVVSKMSSESFITPLRIMPKNKDEKIKTQINYLEQRIYSPPPKENYQIPTPHIFPNQKQPQNYFLEPPLINDLPLKYYPPTYSNYVDYSKNRSKNSFSEYEPNYYPQPIDNPIGDYNFVKTQNYNFNPNINYNESNIQNNYNNVNLNENNIYNKNNIDFKLGNYQQKMDDFSIKSIDRRNRFNQGIQYQNNQNKIQYNQTMNSNSQNFENNYNINQQTINNNSIQNQNKIQNYEIQNPQIIQNKITIPNQDLIRNQEIKDDSSRIIIGNPAQLYSEFKQSGRINENKNVYFSKNYYY